MTLCADCAWPLPDPVYLSLDGRRLLCASCLLTDARRGVHRIPAVPDRHQAAEVWILEQLYTRSAA